MYNMRIKTQITFPPSLLTLPSPPMSWPVPLLHLQGWILCPRSSPTTGIIFSPASSLSLFSPLLVEISQHLQVKLSLSVQVMETLPLRLLVAGCSVLSLVSLGSLSCSLSWRMWVGSWREGWRWPGRATRRGSSGWRRKCILSNKSESNVCDFFFITLF